MASVIGAAKSVTGVADAKVDFPAKTVKVTYDPQQADAEKIAAAIQARKFGATKAE